MDVMCLDLSMSSYLQVLGRTHLQLEILITHRCHFSDLRSLNPPLWSSDREKIYTCNISTKGNSRAGGTEHLTAIVPDCPGGPLQKVKRRSISDRHVNSCLAAAA